MIEKSPVNSDRPREPVLATLAQNLAWGLAWAFFMSVVFALIPLAMTIVRGPRALDSLGLSVKSFLAVFAVGGAGGGVILGICRPVLRWRVAAIIVGSLIALLGFGAMGVAMYGINENTYIIAVPMLIFGGVFGNHLWERNIEPRLPNRRAPEESEDRHPLGRWRPR